MAWVECPDNHGDHIQIEGERHVPGGGGTPERIGDGAPAEPEAGAPEGSPPEEELPPCTREELWEGGLLDTDACVVPKETPAEPEAPDVPAIPPLTERDVLALAPPPPSVVTEPAGVGLVGAPLNVVAPATTHTAEGTLFDLPVTVTFEPERFSFDFGDGTVASTDDGGTTWAELGVPEFTATGTSHAYGERGTHEVTVAVAYRASADFGPWGVHAVEGLVSSVSAPTPVRILSPTTAPVEETCLEDPRGPAC